MIGKNLLKYLVVIRKFPIFAPCLVLNTAPKILKRCEIGKFIDLKKNNV